MDINCDVGEGIHNEEALMALVDSCNIACGGHTGDEDSMVKTLRLARRFGVRAGAHPSFEDRLNFGRRSILVPEHVLKKQLIGQIGTLIELADKEGVTLKHIKAHGALYNMTAHSVELARLFLDVVASFKKDLCIFVPYGSVLGTEAEKAGVHFWLEAFADRNYDDDLNLLPRSAPNAVIDDVEQITERVKFMDQFRKVKTSTGKQVPLEFDTVCVHGDHPAALDILKALSSIKNHRD